MDSLFAKPLVVAEEEGKIMLLYTRKQGSIMAEESSLFSRPSQEQANAKVTHELVTALEELKNLQSSPNFFAQNKSSKEGTGMSEARTEAAEESRRFMAAEEAVCRFCNKPCEPYNCIRLDCGHFTNTDCLEL
eukprot:TRINITY_DN9395_c0_g1_i5.p2 TRINITY_DN9395_c0_g1~~TRINITY_DN9395_c0_g1_i5.p2  ORF type:complete len:133 (-),score=41.55 TRINITY_DN9395_c0_g1_i5:520-918(-)